MTIFMDCQSANAENDDEIQVLQVLYKSKEI